MTTNKNRPDREVRLGQIKAAIWNTSQAGKVRPNVAIGKLYRTKTGDWKLSSYFDPEDLPVLIKVLDTLCTELIQSNHKEAGHE